MEKTLEWEGVYYYSHFDGITCCKDNIESYVNVEIKDAIAEIMKPIGVDVESETEWQLSDENYKEIPLKLIITIKVEKQKQ